jgi:hypothetical protein
MFEDKKINVCAEGRKSEETNCPAGRRDVS